MSPPFVPYINATNKRLPVLCVFGIVPDVNGSTLFRKVYLPRTVNLNKYIKPQIQAYFFVRYIVNVPLKCWTAILFGWREVSQTTFLTYCSSEPCKPCNLFPRPQPEANENSRIEKGHS